MKKSPCILPLLVWALFFAFIKLSSAKADSVYVWCGDGLVHGFPNSGSSIVLTNDFAGWNGPVGLTFDNLGNLYIGQPSSSYIWLFVPTNLVTLFGYVDSVSGMAFSQSGKLIATIPNYSAIIQLEFSFYSSRYSLNGQTTNYTQSHLSFPLSLALDDVGFMYVTSGTNTIQKFNKNFIYDSTFASDLNHPWGLAFDASGNLFVANNATNGLRRNSILKYSPDGTRSTFASAASGLNQPCGIAFDSTGNLFVANSGAGNILKFTPGGIASVFASGLNDPCNIAVYPGLKVYSATPVLFTNSTKLPDGNLQLNMVEPSGLNFAVLAATNLSQNLSNWSNIGNFTETAPNQYQFTDTQTTNNPKRFYRIKSQ
jgi:hypothetical protein